MRRLRRVSAAPQLHRHRKSPWLPRGCFATTPERLASSVTAPASVFRRRKLTRRGAAPVTCCANWLVPISSRYYRDDSIWCSTPDEAGKRREEKETASAKGCVVHPTTVVSLWWGWYHFGTTLVYQNQRRGSRRNALPLRLSNTAHAPDWWCRGRAGGRVSAQYRRARRPAYSSSEVGLAAPPAVPPLHNTPSRGKCPGVSAQAHRLRAGGGQKTRCASPGLQLAKSGVQTAVRLRAP